MKHSGQINLVRVGTKGELIFPASIRKEHQFEPGSLVKTIDTKEFVLVKKLDIKLTEDESRTLKAVTQALDSIEHGKGNVYSKKDYIQKLKKRIAKNES